MKKLVYLWLFCCLEASAAPATISATEWARPRSGEALMQLPALAETVRQLLEAPPGATLQIRYPGGDEGSLWARELQAWLVALGIASTHIELVAGGSNPGSIDLAIVP